MELSDSMWVGVTVGLAVAMVVLVGQLLKPMLKGLAGEVRVRAAGRLGLGKGRYTAFHDVMFRFGEATMQVDHVYVSRFGVFVVETKNMSGSIYGAAADRRWTVVHGRRKRRMFSPIVQNAGHVGGVRRVLGLRGGDSRVVSVVVFAGSAVFPKGRPKGVYKGWGWVWFVRSFRRRVFSDVEVSDLIGRVRGAALEKTGQVKRDHVRWVRSRKRATVKR